MRTRAGAIARLHLAGRAITATVLATVALLLLPAGASAVITWTWPGQVQPTGQEQTVFDWTTQRCIDNNIPDAPPRAFRDSLNRIQLTSPHWDNYHMIGRTFDSLKQNCVETMGSGNNSNPAAFDDKEWISSPYTIDGTRIYALSHMEFQGNTFPGQCISGNYLKCFYASINLAVSKNRGATYTHATPPNHLVAAAPYQYFKEEGPYGIMSPSNIIKSPLDGYYYALVQSQRFLANREGTCVMRTRNLADPKSWRAWKDGSFSMTWKNPYQVIAMERAEPHVCDVVSFPQIEKMTASLTWNTHLDKFMLIDGAGKYYPDIAANRYGIYMSTSSDLVHWSDKDLVMEAPLVYAHGCTDVVGFPAALDHTSRSRNFETTGKNFYLYYTQMHKVSQTNCSILLDRDLIRIPVQLPG